MADSKRARSWKRRTLPRIDLINAERVLYSTPRGLKLALNHLLPSWLASQPTRRGGRASAVVSAKGRDEAVK